MKVQCRDFLSSDHGVARDEFSCFRTTMIDNREYGVESSRFWEVSDQVHGHHLEGSRMGVGRDWLERGFSMCGVRFVLLANHTSSYIIFCEILHIFSLVGLAEEVYGICYSWVTRERVVVVCL